jgi:uncharacterized membrane protein
MSHPEQRGSGDQPPVVEPGVIEQAAARGAERAVEEFRSISVERQGMLPDPEELARYQRYFPGLGERIVSWTEEELLHRRSLERRTVDATIKLASRGQALAFLWAAGALATAAGLALAGKNAGAVTALAAALVPVLLAFVRTVLGRNRDS